MYHWSQLACPSLQQSPCGLLPLQVPPSARGQHTAVWDGDDLLVVFGGVDGAGAFAQPRVHVLSLSRQEWSAPAVQGEGPGPRARHSAAMLGQHGARTMALFGGRSPQVLPPLNPEPRLA
jgi:Galactose oxidase, central domain